MKGVFRESEWRLRRQRNEVGGLPAIDEEVGLIMRILLECSITGCM
jgi:hypothetical protein